MATWRDKKCLSETVRYSEYGTDHDVLRFLLKCRDTVLAEELDALRIWLGHDALPSEIEEGMEISVSKILSILGERSN